MWCHAFCRWIQTFKRIVLHSSLRCTTTDQSTLCYNTEDSSLCSHHCEDVKSQIKLLLWQNNSWWKWAHFSKYSTFFSDGKVTCLRTECPGVETVCDREMTAVAVPGKEDDCCQKYICGMYLNSVVQKYMRFLCPQVQTLIDHMFI